MAQNGLHEQKGPDTTCYGGPGPFVTSIGAVGGGERGLCLVPKEAEHLNRGFTKGRPRRHARP